MSENTQPYPVSANHHVLQMADWAGRPLPKQARIVVDALNGMGPLMPNDTGFAIWCGIGPAVHAFVIAPYMEVVTPDLRQEGEQFVEPELIQAGTKRYAEVFKSMSAWRGVWLREIQPGETSFAIHGHATLSGLGGPLSYVIIHCLMVVPFKEGTLTWPDEQPASYDELPQIDADPFRDRRTPEQLTE